MMVSLAVAGTNGEGRDGCSQYRSSRYLRMCQLVTVVQSRRAPGCRKCFFVLGKSADADGVLIVIEGLNWNLLLSLPPSTCVLHPCIGRVQHRC